MQTQLPLATLIQARMDELGLDRQTLGFLLGYQNPLNPDFPDGSPRILPGTPDWIAGSATYAARPSPVAVDVAGESDMNLRPAMQVSEFRWKTAPKSHPDSDPSGKSGLKASGRVDALCQGHLTSRRSRAALARLPDALGLAAEVVQQAVTETEHVIAEQKWQAEEERRLAREKEEAEWRATFQPHAILQTERTVPTQILICGFTGGVRRWLWIDLDLSKPPITFVRQVLAALPERTEHGRDGQRSVMFFGEVVGFIVNYAPDQALRCDLDGQPLEVLPKAYRPGEVVLSFGNKPVSPTVMARLLGMT